MPNNNLAGYAALLKKRSQEGRSAHFQPVFAEINAYIKNLVNFKEAASFIKSSLQDSLESSFRENTQALLDSVDSFYQQLTVHREIGESPLCTDIAAYTNTFDLLKETRGLAIKQQWQAILDQYELVPVSEASDDARFESKDNEESASSVQCSF